MRHARPALLSRSPGWFLDLSGESSMRSQKISLGRVPRRSLLLFQVIFVVYYFFLLPSLSFVRIDSHCGLLESHGL